jgi:hypothetical protein
VTAVRWAVGGWAVDAVMRDDPGLAEAAFDDPSVWILGSETAQQVQVPDDFSSTAALKYESVRRFTRDVRHERISPDVTAVGYDPEHWAATPVREQRHPFRSMRRFSRIAHAHGYVVLLAPSRDLMLVTGAPCHRAAGETIGDAYLRCDVAARATRYADVVEIQAQAYESDVRAFATFVEQAAGQVHAADTRADVIVGLSTSPGTPVSAETLTAAWRAVTASVDGFFLIADTPDIATTVAFLRAVTS